MSTVQQAKSDGAVVAVLDVSRKPGTLVSLLATSASASGQYIQLWDAITPTDPDAALVFSYALPANRSDSLDTPVEFSRGIQIRVATALTNTPEEFAAESGLGAGAILVARYFLL